MPRLPKTQTKQVITEAHVQKAVTDLLVLDGWRAIRTDPVSDRSKGKGFGEVGMPDYLYVRYFLNGARLSGEVNNVKAFSLVNLLWIEFKKPGAEPKPHQLEWHAAERARGALVFVVDSIDDFIRWYAASGLARKVLKDARK